VFPIVVIDLSDQASPQTIEWVTAACSQAIATGACVAEGTELSEPPLAVAIVRLLAKRNRIHLEVGRRDDSQTTWRTRDLQFRARDPEAERWRTVGLTIATLVGEIVSPSEVAELESTPSLDSAAPSTGSPRTAAPAAPAPDAAQRDTRESAPPPASNPPEAKPVAASRPARPAEPVEASKGSAPRTAAPPRVDPAPELPEMPQPTRGGFIGLAFTAGPGLSDFGLRWGGAARVGWMAEGGWLLALSGSYSRHEARDAAATVSWLHLGLGVGRRFELSPVWGAAVSAGAGARRVAFRAADGGRSGDLQAWNPFLMASGEFWRHLGRGVSIWAALDVTGLSVETRMLVSGAERFVLPRIDTVGLLGLRWMP
jgi:hypothetical protein